MVGAVQSSYKEFKEEWHKEDPKTGLFPSYQDIMKTFGDFICQVRNENNELEVLSAEKRREYEEEAERYGYSLDHLKFVDNRSSQLWKRDILIPVSPQSHPNFYEIYFALTDNIQKEARDCFVGSKNAILHILVLYTKVQLPFLLLEKLFPQRSLDQLNV